MGAGQQVSPLWVLGQEVHCGSSQLVILRREETQTLGQMHMKRLGCPSVGGVGGEADI